MAEGYATKVRPEKTAAVDEIKESIGDEPTIVLTEYRGLSVQALKDLRQKLAGADTSYRVVKNTLARLAADQLGLGEITEQLNGPTAIAYVKGDAVAAAKVLATFAKEHPELVIKGGVLDGRVLTADETSALATIDALDVSRAKIAGLLTAALRQIVFTLEAPARQILFVLEEIGKRGAEASAEAEVAEAEAAPEAEAPAAEEVVTEEATPSEETTRAEEGQEGEPDANG